MSKLLIFGAIGVVLLCVHPTLAVGVAVYMTITGLARRA